MPLCFLRYSRTAVDMQNIRVLVGYLVQKLVQGLAQLIGGVALLAAFATGPVLSNGFGAALGEAAGVRWSGRRRRPALPRPLAALLGPSFANTCWVMTWRTCAPLVCLPAGAAVGVSAVELAVSSLIVRSRHRLARSALGRLYGLSYEVFTAMSGVQAMALQRTLAGEREGCAGLAPGCTAALCRLLALPRVAQRSVFWPLLAPPQP